MISLRFLSCCERLPLLILIFHKSLTIHHFLSLGDGTFTDVTRSANLGPSYYGNGAGWIDVDSDGDLDLFVTTVGDTRHYLYINNGGRFSEEGVERGVSLKYASGRKLAGFTPVFGDFDQDGFLDIFTTEWIMNSQAGTKVRFSILNYLCGYKYFLNDK